MFTNVVLRMPCTVFHVLKTVLNVHIGVLYVFVPCAKAIQSDACSFVPMTIYITQIWCAIIVNELVSISEVNFGLTGW